MVNEAMIDRIRDLLSSLEPLELQIEDESERHAGHPGARAGGRHYRLLLISPRFPGLTRLQRHRLVYDCLATLIPGQIHALAMTLLSPKEAASAGSHPPSRE
ncbi:MAG TPA: BolA family protein [Burkholderiaceae bacterium]|nr:BolA family protein [Burkholderiaceae bacterium]